MSNERESCVPFYTTRQPLPIDAPVSVDPERGGVVLNGETPGRVDYASVFEGVGPFKDGLDLLRYLQCSATSANIFVTRISIDKVI